MAFVEKFKHWVDISFSTIPTNGMAIRDLEAFLALESDNSHPCPIERILQHIKSRIADLLVVDRDPAQASNYDLLTVQRHLIIDNLLNGTDYQPYWALAYVIQNALQERKTFNGFMVSSDTAWQEAIKLAIRYRSLKPDAGDESLEDIRQVYERFFKVGEAAKWFQDRGIQLRLEDGRRYFNDEDRKKIAQEIDDSVRMIGGSKFARLIFEEMSQLYDPVSQRYRVDSCTRSLTNYRYYQIPYAYLLNLCVKHLDSDPENVESANLFESQLVETAQFFASVHDVQPYNLWQHKIFYPVRVIPFLREKALYDRLFNFKQFDCSRLPDLIRKLFWFAYGKISDDLGFTPAQASILCNEIFNLHSGNQSLTIFTSEELGRHSQIADPVIRYEILTTFSHDPKTINESFLCPRDTADNFWSKPLVRLDGQRYLLVNKAWCSWNCYEAIFQQLITLFGDEWRKVNEMVGSAFESYVHHIFRQKGVDCLSGKYKFGKGKKRECDLVIETQNSIIFFELKKKALTKLAETGDDLALLVDAGCALLETQIQLIKHSISLRELGKLTFEYHESPQNLELGSRKMALVSLSLHEFPAFQDTSNVGQILRFMSSSTFSAADSNESESAVAALKKLNEKCKDLISLEKKYKELSTGSIEEAPRLERWFLSLGQLIELLEGVQSGENFELRLRNIPSF